MGLRDKWGKISDFRKSAIEVAKDPKEAAKEYAKKKAAQKVKKEIKKKLLGAAAKGGAQAAGTAATGAGAGAAGAGTLVAGFWIVVIIILVILVVGFFAAIFLAPSTVLGTIKEYIEDTYKAWFWDEESRFAENASESALNTASYLRKKGYDLYNEGLITKKLPAGLEARIDTDEKLKEKYPFLTKDHRYLPEEGIYVGDGDNVTAAEIIGTPLWYYTWMGAYTYFIAEQPMGYWYSAAQLFNYGYHNRIDVDGEKFKGLLEFTDENGFWKRWFNSSPSLTLNLDNNTLKTEASGFLGSDGSYVDFSFDINGWSGRYGLPLNLLMAFHKSTHAPDFLIELIKATKIENGEYKKPVLKIGLVEHQGTAKIVVRIPSHAGFKGVVYRKEKKTDTNAQDKYIEIRHARELGEEFQYYAEKLYFKKNNGEFLAIPAVTAFNEDGTVKYTSGKEVPIVWGAVERYGLYDIPNTDQLDTDLGTLASSIGAGFMSEASIKKTQPVLRRTHNHWYRDTYWSQQAGQGEDSKFVEFDTDYLIKQGELWTKLDEKNQALVNEEQGSWSAYRSEGGDEKVEDGKEIGEPLTKGMFEPGSENEEAFERVSSQLDSMHLILKFDTKTDQISDARRGITNPRLLNLLKDYYWYEYDGTREKAELINKDREENGNELDQVGDNTLKKKVTFGKSALEAGAMLQNSDDLDSKYAYRDLKELMVELGAFKKDDLREPVRKILTWPMSKTSAGVNWPAGEKNKPIESYGIRILSEDAVTAEYGMQKNVEDRKKIEGRQIAIQELRNEIQVINEDKELDATERSTKVSEKQKEIQKIEKEVKDMLEKSKEEAQKIEEETQQILNSTEEGKNIQKERSKDSDPIFRIIKSRYGKGYKKDEEVVAPATGKITFEDDVATIEVLSKEDLDKIPEGYKEFYESEYRGRIAGYKIKIKGIEKGINPEKSTYNGQINPRMIEKISNKTEKEKVENSEKIKKDAPKTHGEYVKEGTVIGKVKGAGVTDYIEIVMQDTDESLVDRVEEYIQKRGTRGEFKVMEDYETRTSTTEVEKPQEIYNELDPDDPESVEKFKTMFKNTGTGPTIMEKYPEVFLEMQKKYGVNAIFAGAVARVETSGGTNGVQVAIREGGGEEYSHNYFNIRALEGEPASTDGFKMYPSHKEGIESFFKLIAKGSYYHKNKQYTVEEISDPYCVPPEGWARDANNFMTDAIEIAIEEGF